MRRPSRLVMRTRGTPASRALSAERTLGTIPPEMTPPSIREELHERLRQVVERRTDAPFWIDDRPRSIPDHYHAHARRRHDWTTR